MVLSVLSPATRNPSPFQPPPQQINICPYGMSINWFDIYIPLPMADPWSVRGESWRVADWELLISIYRNAWSQTTGLYFLSLTKSYFLENQMNK